MRAPVTALTLALLLPALACKSTEEPIETTTASASQATDNATEATGATAASETASSPTNVGPLTSSATEPETTNVGPLTTGTTTGEPTTGDTTDTGPLANPCCSEHDSPGCPDDPAVEACVCEQEPLCCDPDLTWDIFCVMAVTENHCAVCPQSDTTTSG